MIELIENEIIEKLRTSEMFEGMDIDSFPAQFEDYSFLSALGCLLVQYNGQSFTDPETLAKVSQTDTYTYIIYVGLRSLSFLREGFPVIEEVKDILTGFVINGGKLYPTSIDYVGKPNPTDNFWKVTFKLKLPNASRYERNNVYEMYNNPLTEKWIGEVI